MRKRTKIILTIGTLTLLTVAYLFFQGLHLMTIEDHYGDNQEFFFKSKSGDIIVNRTLNEIKKLEKSRNRIFFVDNADTTDLYHWLVRDKIKIYRPETENKELSNLTITDVDELIQKEDIILVIEN
jgi:hypothetical protein